LRMIVERGGKKKGSLEELGGEVFDGNWTIG
jgi:hypothetical protein